MFDARTVNRVLKIQSPAGVGTAFSLTLGSERYLITALHVLVGEGVAPRAGSQVTLDIAWGDAWNSFTFEVIGAQSDPLDVVVLKALERIPKVEAEIALGYSGLPYGAEAFFLGFPYGKGGAARVLMHFYPIPFVKKGVLSKIALENEIGQRTFWLDAVSNIGFSGGPVLFRNDAGAWQICGVVTSAMQQVSHLELEIDGKTVPIELEQDAGLVECCPIDFALKLIPGMVRREDGTWYFESIADDGPQSPGM